MKSEPNPYAAPTVVGTEVVEEDNCRPALGTVLIGIWLLEGGFKAYVVGSGLLRGFNPIPYVIEDYPTWNPFVFFLVSSFVIVETIGPWIGIFYLAGRRSRTIPFNTALWETLKVAGGLAVVCALTLMLYCEVVGGRN